jgi:hypothetical protein
MNSRVTLVHFPGIGFDTRLTETEELDSKESGT